MPKVSSNPVVDAARAVVVVVAALLPSCTERDASLPDAGSGRTEAVSDAGVDGGDDVVPVAPDEGGDDVVACTVVAPTSCEMPALRYVDVEPIFQARCQTCHAPGAGAWPLVTYQHVADWAPDVRDLVLHCAMPPPSAHVPMTDDERAAILAWIRCGFPE